MLVQGRCFKMFLLSIILYFFLFGGFFEMKQLTILTENKPGILGQIASLLGRSGINMESLTADTTAESGIIRVLTKDVETAKKVLKENNFSVVESDIACLGILDRPGELGKIAQLIAREGINIDQIYLLSKNHDKAFLAVKVNDLNKLNSKFKEYVVNY